MKRLFFAIMLLLSCTQVNATLVTYNDYSLITESNIVKNGSTEWLQWDVTRGMSITTALRVYGADGWSLASQTDMAGLFNDFSLGDNRLWDTDENTGQITLDRHNRNDDVLTDPEVQFLELFGFTWDNFSPNHVIFDRELYATALYGDDADGDGMFNLAQVHDDYYFDGAFEAGEVFLDRDLYDDQYSAATVGVALVRNVPASPESTAIPSPPALGFLLAGLCSVFWRRRR